MHILQKAGALKITVIILYHGDYFDPADGKSNIN